MVSVANFYTITSERRLIRYSAVTTFAPFSPVGVTAPSEHVDSYNLLNLRGAYKFWQQKAEAGYMRDAEVAISAFNALNDEHKEHPLGRYDRQPRHGLDHGEVLT